MCRTNLIEFNFEDNISTKYSTDADSENGWAIGRWGGQMLWEGLSA